MTHLLSVGHLIVVSDQAYHRCVISKFDDDIGAVCSCTVMYREYRSGLRKQPCGAPVLRVRGDDVLLPILTTWLLPVRKSRIQLHRDLFSPRVWSFANQCGRHYGVKCWTIIHEQHPHIGVLIFQVGESSAQGEGNSIVCGTVLESVPQTAQKQFTYRQYILSNTKLYANTVCSGSSEAAAQSRCGYLLWLLNVMHTCWIKVLISLKQGSQIQIGWRPLLWLTSHRRAVVTLKYKKKTQKFWKCTLIAEMLAHISFKLHY